MEIDRILEKLFGEIYPYGDTNIDVERYENLSNYRIALDYIINRLRECANFNNDNRASCQNIGYEAYNILFNEKQYIDECLEENKR